MKNKFIRILVIGLPLLLIAFLFNSFSADSVKTKENIELSQDTSKIIKETPLMNLGTYLQSVNQGKVTQEDDSQEKETQAPFFEAETKARLIQIADTFADDIQYPDYSKPIRNQDELQKYLPNQSVASSLDLDVKQADSPNISIKASKLQYFRGEVITGEAVITNVPNGEDVSVSARLVNSGNVIAETDGMELGAQGAYLVSFEPETISAPPHANHLRLIATFTVNGRQYEIGTPVQYENAVASIDYVADAQVNDTFLEIPIYLTTSQPGYHQVSANLYNAETGQALLHLSADKELLVEKDFILLKAHIAALKASGHEGPYFLDNLTLTRMPSPPKFVTEFGQVLDHKTTVNAYPFTDYRDEPYIDEEAQERLEFLTKLGGET